jgi:hypothetical protein
MGKGDGTFNLAANYPVGASSSSVAVGDLNGDGILDLVVATSSGISVLLGYGNGGFQPAVNYAAGTSTHSVVVGDFNGDGKLDLAVPNGVLLGNGDGTFQTAVNSAAGTSPYSVAVGDFNGDGGMDLAVANFNSGVAILLQPTPAPAPSGGAAQLTGGNTFSGNQTVNGTMAATGFVGDGSGLSGVNAATVTNGVYTTGQYADPSWITSLSGSKITGSVVSALTAGTLSTTPTTCSPNFFSVGIVPNGNAICVQPVSTNLADNANLVFNTQANIFTGGKQTLSASTTNYASLNLPNTGAPPAPPLMGDLWLTIADTHLMFQDKNNTTQSLAFLSDLTSGTSGLLAANNSFTGSNSFSQTINGSITGNAGTVTNGVYTTTPYADPAWITSLSAGKIIGSVPSATTAITAGSATTATIANTATNALNLGNVPANEYARVDAGNTLTGNQAVTGNVNITGNSTTSGSVTIGNGGTAIKEHLSMTFNPKFPPLLPLSCSAQSFTFTGASDGDTLLLGVPSSRMNGGGTVVYTAWVSTANTVTIQVCNVFASPQKSAGTGAIRVDIWKH